MYDPLSVCTETLAKPLLCPVLRSNKKSKPRMTYFMRHSNKHSSIFRENRLGQKHKTWTEMEKLKILNEKENLATWTDMEKLTTECTKMNFSDRSQSFNNNFFFSNNENENVPH